MDVKLAQQIEKKGVVEVLGDGKPLRIGFKRLTEAAVIPKKAHATDSGFDLCASEDVIISPGETVIMPTDIAVQLPAGYEAQVRPRSGVTAKTKLRVQLGTIDNSFKGGIGVIVDNIANEEYVFTEKYGGEEIKVMERRVKLRETHAMELVGSPLYTPSEELVPVGTYLIRKGDRIAQLVIQRLPDVIAVEVADVGESERGAGGFGSTGVTTKGEL